MLSVACAAPAFAAEATLIRIFLKDGGVLVSYGEFARVEDRVVFSMPVGGTGDEPRLQVVWVAADAVDWPRTERYASSTRYQQYVQSRAEEDFQKLNDDVARVLNEIAVTTDRPKAMELASQARAVLSDWPRTHEGYRQDDVKEILGLVEEAIADLRAAEGQTSFDLALVADVPPVDIEPVLGMPTQTDQFEQVLRLADLTSSPSERIELLKTARALLDEGGGAAFVNHGSQRQALDRRIQGELETQSRYERLSSRLVTRARREAERARVSSVEKVLQQIESEDEKLGRRRPDIVASIRAAVTANLEAARNLRLRRDRWLLRQDVYQDYQRRMGSQIVTLVKARASLESIRRLDGPKVEALRSLLSRLSGGSERLQRLTVAEELRATHDLVVGAWRFAENATRQRADAVASGDITKAWAASSAAAGALMMLSHAQATIRELLEPPRLQ